MWEDVCQGLGSHWWNALQHGGSEGRLDGIDIRGAGPTCNLYDSLQLVHRGRTREEGLMSKKLTQDTAEGPQIDSLCVLGGPQKDFRGTVPACRHIVRQHRCWPTSLWVLKSTDGAR